MILTDQEWKEGVPPTGRATLVLVAQEEERSFRLAQDQEDAEKQESEHHAVPSNSP